MADFSSIQDELQQQQDKHEQNGTKRKRQEDGQGSRARRNRYISIACNECKRRKIKCNGETPCQRCGNLQLDCIYAPNNCCSNNFKDTVEFKQMQAHIMSLQAQVDALWEGMNALRGSLGHEVYPQDVSYTNVSAQQPTSVAPQAAMVIDPVLHPAKSSALRQSRSQDQTGSANDYGIAKSSLQHARASGAADGHNAGDAAQDEPSAQSPVAFHGFPTGLHPSLHVLATITKEDALRLCQVYEDEVGSMYPILDIKFVKQHAQLVFGLGDAVFRQALIFKGTGEGLNDPDLDILRLILAIALLCDSSEHDELARKFYESTSYTREHQDDGVVGLKQVQIMILAALYSIHVDDEDLSQRNIRIAVKACTGLGLHLSETYPRLFTSDQDRVVALKAFWSVYVLAGCRSFGTSTASPLSDFAVDSALPEPDGSSPYLAAMCSYCKIGFEAWFDYKVFGSAGSVDTVPKHAIASFDQRIQQWYENLPSSLQYDHPKWKQNTSHHRGLHQDHDANADHEGQAQCRQKALIYLSLNQMRMLLHRPALHSATTISTAWHYAQRAVDVAKDSIAVLSDLHERKDIYCAQQAPSHDCLVSALGMLILAVCHAPSQFSNDCRKEFNMAVDLVRHVTPTSFALKRLSTAIEGLEGVSPKVNLHAGAVASKEVHAKQQSSNQPSRSHVDQFDYHDTQESAAMAMASLAGHHVDFSVPMQGGKSHDGRQSPNLNAEAQSSSLPNTSSSSRNGIADDLNLLFEVAASGQGGNASVLGDTADGNTRTGKAAIQRSAQMPQHTGGTGSVQVEASRGIAYGHEEEFDNIVNGLF